MARGELASLGITLGALLRSVAAGISVLVGARQHGMSPYLPSPAGESMFAVHGASSQSVGRSVPGSGPRPGRLLPADRTSRIGMSLV